ncbi:MAG: CpaF family protein, partial [Actinomycetota bacterium]
ITHVTEIVGMEGDVITLQDLFLFDYSAGVDAEGRFLGNLKSTGLRPHFIERMQERGISVRAEVFSPEGRAA